MKKTVIIGGNSGIGKVIFNVLKKRGDKIVKISRTQFNKKIIYLQTLALLKDYLKSKKYFTKKKLTTLFLRKDIAGTIQSKNIKLWLNLRII